MGRDAGLVGGVAGFHQPDLVGAGRQAEAHRWAVGRSADRLAIDIQLSVCWLHLQVENAEDGLQLIIQHVLGISMNADLLINGFKASFGDSHPIGLARCQRQF